MIAHEDTVVCHLKSVRQARGVSQIQLAQRVGVKRQAIYDIESGRYLPNTALALKLARHLGCRVEDLFVDRPTQPDQPVRLMDDAGRKTPRVAVSRLRGRLLAYPLAGEHALNDGLRSADALLEPESGRIRLLCPEETVDRTVVLFGCDPAFAILSAHLARRTPEARVHCRFASSHRALEALCDGAAHLAGTHLHSTGEKDANVGLVRERLGDSGALVIGFSLMEEGLMVARNNPRAIRRIADLAGEKVRMVNREPGAALRVLLDDHLARAGIPPATVGGYDREIHSHLEGARIVAHGLADAALGLRVVAEACGIDFVPVATVRCDLVIPRDLTDHPVVKILLDTLQTRLLREELAAIPGYGADRTGDVIAAA